FGSVFIVRFLRLAGAVFVFTIAHPVEGGYRPGSLIDNQKLIRVICGKHPLRCILGGSVRDVNFPILTGDFGLYLVKLFLSHSSSPACFQSSSISSGGSGRQGRLSSSRDAQ